MAEVGANAHNPATSLENLEELHTLLTCSDLRALEVYTRLQRDAAVIASDGFDALSQSIAAFDFVQAATQCDQLACWLRSQSIHR